MPTEEELKLDGLRVGKILNNYRAFNVADVSEIYHLMTESLEALLTEANENLVWI
jgi:hypothetical protein